MLKYGNIVLFKDEGGWQADYDNKLGSRFGLHRCCCKTKQVAYEVAKECVDSINELKEKEL